MKWSESLKEQISVLSDSLASASLAAAVEKQLSISASVKGFHYFTGIGKNGFVAAKVASTFNSLGIRSMFIDPVNTLHGDMDIFTPDDLVLAISKSGETEELIVFLRALRNMGFNKIVSVVSKQNSTISKLAMHTIEIPVRAEGDHLGLAPIASSIAYMAVLQSIGVELSSARGFSKSDFVRGHPGGSLGKTRV